VVDDEEGLVRLAEEVLASLGYEPVGCLGALEALSVFRAAPERFDAVVSDVIMPDMTGPSWCTSCGGCSRRCRSF